MDASSIFTIQSPSDFNSVALQVYRHQYTHNLVYQEFCNYLKKTPSNVSKVVAIPFLPIEFFKSKKVVATTKKPEILFTSSGTTGTMTSTHYVTDVSIYEESYLKAFTHFYGAVTDYCVLALLPSYLERQGSSLIYMADDLIKRSKHPESGFYLDTLDLLVQKLKELDQSNTKILLIGVSFALLDIVENYTLKLKNVIIMETGGMKGRRKEMIREELHDTLKEGFGVQKIHSEYGMTELLSQAYSKGDGIFETPPWMDVIIRDPEDALSYQSTGKTGGVNVIDLANINSCSFIATQDLGKKYDDDTFEVLGRFDHSDIRGCNLLVF
ncbi:putative acyl protein synthase/acyl-CoA reductase-like protein [Cellulophaga algicola DSM 14237]|uniref:Acyl protein synthase/acyl-CoA reductase-like protein n=1 Tax=Cellulophaga algicola (strain DSM 14237 / IC166 / ACAM 630) TaxID=688270 RepID=E6X533_CELAD|nr:acyltransferase [Cellulophaga algicola]ADV48344.1 putative acyl protein synthase/acyl-CoA reductase-like protein [Cellulophaga algicola DSM 14237]